jgi:hypothetical protein
MAKLLTQREKSTQEEKLTPQEKLTEEEYDVYHTRWSEMVAKGRNLFDQFLKKADSLNAEMFINEDNNDEVQAKAKAMAKISSYKHEAYILGVTEAVLEWKEPVMSVKLPCVENTLKRLDEELDSAQLWLENKQAPRYEYCDPVTGMKTYKLPA